nr:glucoamylase family protein [bacterium]
MDIVHGLAGYVASMRLDTLYDKERGLFFIGREAGQRPQDIHYDLYASEARLLSIAAMALGRVEPEHWKRLSRPIARYGSDQTLYAWSGTMFEYLMPGLLVKPVRHTLGDFVARGAVRMQKKFAKRENIPFGVSECGMMAVDADGWYQYRAFGVPACALANERASRICSAYAAYLAAGIDPKAAMDSINAQYHLGAWGPYGLMEAIDFDDSRVPQPGHAVVTSYMAHHQGMALCAIANAVEDNALCRLFEARPDVQAMLPTIQEAVPDAAPLRRRRTGENTKARCAASATPLDPWAMPPRMQLLGAQGQMTMICANGEGDIWRDGRRIGRFEGDGVCAMPTYRLQMAWQGRLYSLLPTGRGERPRAPRVLAMPGRMCFSGWAGGHKCRVDVMADPDTGADIRFIRVKNTSRHPCEITLWGEMDLGLMAMGAFDTHPSFASLFLQTHLEDGLLLAARTPRMPQDKAYYVGMALIGDVGRLVAETDRYRVPGRDGAGVPDGAHPQSHAVESILALGARIRLEAGQEAMLGLAVLAGADKGAVIDGLRKLRRNRALQNLPARAAREQKLELSLCRLTPQEHRLALEAASCLFYRYRSTPCPDMAAQSLLWETGISGDVPLAVCRVDGLKSGLQAIRRHAYLARMGFRHDAAILFASGDGYHRPLQDAFEDEVRRLRAPSIHLLVASHLSAGAMQAIRSWGIDTGHEGGQLKRRAPRQGREAAIRQANVQDNLCVLHQYSGDGRAIHLTVDSSHPTPRPWCNVLANPYFGAVVSEKGALYAWLNNCREGRILPWTNDPVRDRASCAIYLSDLSGEHIFGAMPACDDAAFDVTHAMGVSRFEACHDGVRHRLSVFVRPDADCLVYRLVLENTTKRIKKLRVACAADVCPGALRREKRHGVKVTLRDNRLLAGNMLSPESPVAALAAPGQQRVETLAAREAFYDAAGCPAGMKRGRWVFHPGADPILAMRCSVALMPGQRQEILFALSAGGSATQALHAQPEGQSGEQLELAALDRWQDRLSAFEANTPDADFNRLFDWVRYQAVASRLWARSGFYQSGGAFGFRDQLQDMMCLLESHPQEVRAHLLNSAAHQYREGDVQHWWHPPRHGVRTTFKDDLLFLPYVTAAYVRATGDESILGEQVPYLVSPPLGQQERERYETPAISPETQSLYRHCLKAFEAAWKTGQGGLPLMSGGDWNDAMNVVGDDGGTSVWLAMFLLVTARDFLPLMRQMGDDQAAERMQQGIEHLREAIEHAWDGAWYRRAYYGDGQPLGSSDSQACQIDELSQCWAVLALGDTPRTRQAVDSALQYLFDEQAGVLKLLTPAFTPQDRLAGYINAYPPGVRENGGQYTHAAAWMLLAACRLGREELVGRLLAALNPMARCKTRELALLYAGEPYVVAGDVGGVEPYLGKAGWTWYTGSAAWMMRAMLSGVLGFEKVGSSLRLSPCLPPEWPGYTLTYRYGKSVYCIQVSRGGEKSLTLDGIPCGEEGIPLVDDGGEHAVCCHMGK